MVVQGGFGGCGGGDRWSAAGALAGEGAAL
jgi:hypothetical protein